MAAQGLIAMTKLEVFNLVLECRDSAAERKGIFRRASHEVLTWLEEARKLRAFYLHRLYNLVLGDGKPGL